MNKIKNIFHSKRSSKQLLPSGTQPNPSAWMRPVPGPLAFPLAAWNIDKNLPF